MSTYSLSHLSDFVLLRDLKEIVGRDRATTAAMLAHIAEVDARKLYLPAACSSMYAYCVQELRLSEEAAFKRIHAARVARRFPAILGAVADGRLHLSAIVMLASHLTENTADELLAAAERKTKAEIELLLAVRFPRPDVPGQVRAIAGPPAVIAHDQHAPGRVSDIVQTSTFGTACATQEVTHFERPTRLLAEPRPRVAPLSPQRFAIQFTADQEFHDDLRAVQSLLGHQVPTGDVARVMGMALKLLRRHLQNCKFAATDRPHKIQRPSSAPRTVPAYVRREVWNRDDGQCTFVSESGQRCSSRARLEFDHVDEVARGGEATVDGIRLRCRAHNQFTAELRFGVDFMNSKRAEAQEQAAARKSMSSRFPNTAHATPGRLRSHGAPG